MPISTSTKAFAAVIVLIAVAVLGVTLLRPGPSTPPPPVSAAGPVVRGGSLSALAAGPHVLFKGTSGLEHGSPIEIVALSDPSGIRATASLECDRISFAGGRGVCLQTRQRLVTTYEAVLFDSGLKPTGTLRLAGAPTRTRVSADGRYGAATVFVTGQAHGYASVSFSTQTTIIDMAKGSVLGDLEAFTTRRDGQIVDAKDRNFWGVTFAHDSNVFYATLMTAGRRYLVRGDIAARSLVVLHENVECPALSPDGTRIAYKKRVGGDLAPWRFYVLDLATMAERPIEAETRSIDDQLEWLDDSRVLYGAPRSSQSPITDVWVAPVSGKEPARPFILEASSPIVVR